MAAATADFTSATAFSVPAGAFLTASSTSAMNLRCASATGLRRRWSNSALVRGGDVVQVTAVGGGLLGGRLQQAGLQREQFLRVLDRQRGLGGSAASAMAALATCRFSSTSFSTPSKALLVRPKRVSTLALWAARMLFSGQHGVTPVRLRLTGTRCIRVSFFAALHHGRSIRVSRGLQALFVAPQQDCCGSACHSQSRARAHAGLLRRPLRAAAAARPPLPDAEVPAAARSACGRLPGVRSARRRRPPTANWRWRTRRPTSAPWSTARSTRRRSARSVFPGASAWSSARGARSAPPSPRRARRSRRGRRRQPGRRHAPCLRPTRAAAFASSTTSRWRRG